MSVELPCGWAAIPLESLAKITAGVGFPPVLQGRTHGDYPLAKVGDVSRAVRNGDGTIGDAGHWIDEADLKVLRATPLPAGSILFAKIGEAIRQNFRALTTRSMVVDNNVMALVPYREVVDERFLLHFSRMQDWYPLAVATTVPSLRKSDLGAVHVPVAPLNEQRRIVAKLEALQTRSRRARDALDAVPPLLEKLRQSILASAFRGDLTKDWRAQQNDVEHAAELLKRVRSVRRQKWEVLELAKLESKGRSPTDYKWKTKYNEPEPADVAGQAQLPEGWAWATVELAGDVLLGRRRSAEEYVAGVQGRVLRPYVRVANVKEDRLVLDDVLEMPFNEKELALYTLVPGDIVLSEGQSPELVGQSAIYKGGLEHLCIQATVHRFRADEFATTSEFAQLVFLNHLHSGYFRAAASLTTNIAHLTSERLKPLRFPLPPLAEQALIVERARRLLVTLRSLELRLRDLRAAEGNLGSAILTKAFRGELVPQDPTDEPAEVTLARARSATISVPSIGTPQKRGQLRSEQGAEQPND